MGLLRATLTSSIFLKVSSLIFGFLLWHTVCDLFPSSMWVKVPVYFYNTGSKVISAAENVELELSGKRIHISRLDKDQLAVHLNAQGFKVGHNYVTIGREDLLMPSSITVVSSIPQKLPIHVSEPPHLGVS